MNGSASAVIDGAPLQFSTVGPILSEKSILVIDRAIKYLAGHLSPKNDDFTQDLISVALRAIHYAHVTYEPSRGASIETFLIRCSHRAMVDLLRTERRHSAACTPGDASVSPKSDETVFDKVIDRRPETDPEQNFLLRQVELAVLELPDRQRECIRLHFYEDVDRSAIAERLGISRPRVSQLIATGLKNLRARFVYPTLRPVLGLN
jgi:RNA polymerase sigma factor (sigma-70 family)